MNNIIRTILAAIIAALTLTAVGVANAVDTTDQSTPVMQGQAGIIHRTAIIRLGTTVYLHTNSAHGSIGITSHVLSGGCTLVIRTDEQPGEKVLAAIAEEDETMARLGVTAGSSGGNGETTITLYRNGSPICANSSIFGTNANIWFHQVSEVPVP